MGGSESKGKLEDSSQFTNEERQSIQKFYTENNLSGDGFMKLFISLGEQASTNLKHYILSLRQSGHHKSEKAVSIEQFEKFLGYVLKGYYPEKSIVFAALCSTSKTLKIQEIFWGTKQLIRAYKTFVLRDPMWNNWNLSVPTMISEGKFVLHLLQEIFEKGFPPQIDNDGNIKLPPDTVTEYSETDIESMMSKSPLFMYIFDAVFGGLFHLESQNDSIHDMISSLVTVPYTEPVQGKPVPSQLDIYQITFINFNLLKDLQAEWRIVFSNHLYGDSFTQLLSRIQNKGPTLLVVTDKTGHKFGGFCSKSWELNPKFYGTSDCFLFSLTEYGIYHTTQYNENYMYLNHGQQTLPNGLGMGGQFDYFGLWIDQSFNHGHSKAKPKCTTYGSPQLSGTPEFEVDMIEVWGLGPEPKNEDSDEEVEKQTKKSILDKEPEAKALLNLIGKEQRSEGFQEREDDDMSEEMKRKMNTIPKLI
ncbi:hypothetical protein KUTeg_019049 [Tegillarca granosa]|uniref:MTOR-associated protein MEAK7 n=1 Tax=Tegillarca granosa TaxID=220873 RepID=A0ABQ9EHC3_TEGGR|nr:hypothetical protein KUTeg_019049 [Tegillarca granosa]